MPEAILYDSHMHTPLCKHAIGQPEAYAATAQKNNIKGIIFTCHNPGPPGWDERIRMRLEQFDEYVDMVQRTREAYAGKVDVRLGLESDFVPGMEPFLETLHNRAEFHHILGSVHPHAGYYKKEYYTGDAKELYITYFNHLAMAAESKLFDTLSHPDIVKTVFPSKWDPFGVWDTVQYVLDRIAKTGVAMELNTSGLHKQIKEMNPGTHMLAAMHERNIPVVLGSDSHEPRRVGANFDVALTTLEEIGFTQVHYYLHRRRHSVTIADAKTSLGVRATRLGMPDW
jgi:histidinol-phosphatase (PHP family)